MAMTTLLKSTLKMLSCGLLLLLLNRQASAEAKVVEKAVTNEDHAVPSQKRSALVIGAGKYAGGNLAALPGIHQDVQEMKGALEKAGFSVTVLEDPTTAQMNQALEKFHGVLKEQQGIGVLYFSGHSVETNGRAFLLPVDTKVSDPAEILEPKNGGIEIKRVIDSLESVGNTANLVFLDTDGITLPVADRMFIGCAAKAKTNAMASPEGSIFTKALASRIQEQGVSIDEMYAGVAADVSSQVKEQIPGKMSSLTMPFQFLGNGNPLAEPAANTEARIRKAFQDNLEKLPADKMLSKAEASLLLELAIKSAKPDEQSGSK
jgi:uncharacterized caspase-like protein